MNDQRRASDELLLRMIREGRHDSEIAVRLGLSTGELRGRKNDLRNRLGQERWDQAIGAASAKPRSSRKRSFFWGMGVAAGLLAILLVIANVFAGEDDEGSLVSAKPVATPTTSPSTLKTPAVVTLDGVEYDDVGVVFSGAATGGKVSLAADNRAGLSVLRFGGTTFVSPTEFADWGISGGQSGVLTIRASVGRRKVELTVLPENRYDTKLRTIGSGVGPIMELSSAAPAGAPTVIVMAYGSQRQRLQVRVENDGRMFIARSPILSSWVLDEASGARIDVSAAKAVGSLGTTGGLSTQCDHGVGTRTCQAIVFGGNIFAPANGAVRCLEGGVVRFEAGSTVLLLLPRTVMACTPRDVSQGEVLVPSGQWGISADESAGGSTSVAVARDGTLYLGEMKGTVLCPCLQGS